MDLWGRHMGCHWVVNKIVSHLGPDFPLFHDSLFLVPKVISSSNALDLSKRRNIAINKNEIPMNEEYLSEYYKNCINTKQKGEMVKKFTRQNI